MTRTSRCPILLVIFHAFLFLTAAHAQHARPTAQPTAQPKNAPVPFAAPAPTSQAEKDNFPPQLLEELSAIKTAALADDYAFNQLAHLTENIGPRISGSLQAKAAVDYVAAELRQLGLDVQLEEVKVPHWVRGAETAELVEYSGQAKDTRQKIVLTALGGSSATPAQGITADVVVVSDFDQLNALGREGVVGKIVPFNEIYDKQK